MTTCNVNMDAYWGYIATPLFFGVVGFGTFTLFTAKDIQLVDTTSIQDTVLQIRAAAKPAIANPLGAAAAAAASVIGVAASAVPKPGGKGPGGKGPGGKGPGGKGATGGPGGKGPPRTGLNLSKVYTQLAEARELTKAIGQK